MTVETKHPDYSTRAADWKLCRLAYEGEAQIKKQGETYLPKPSGYKGYPDGGYEAYSAYMLRAQFPEIMAPSVGAMVGVIHDDGIAVELPDSLSYLAENIDGKGTTLEDFHRGITRQLLVLGRYGVLTDAELAGGDPYLAGYCGDTIINWDDGFFVLNESGPVRNGFQWDHKDQYRVLSLQDGVYEAAIWADSAPTDITPTKQGGGLLDFIPFVVASAKDMGPQIETPPMVGIARPALAIYQLSADERLQLYMSGQETLVAINGEAPTTVGAGAVVAMQGSPDMTPDLKYVSPTCAGIAAHAEAIQRNRDAAVHAGARMFEQSSQGQESGKARTLRFRSETANLKTIAQSSCSLLEAALRNAARLKNQSDTVVDSIVVTPPKDLLDSTMTPQDAVSLFSLVIDGGLSQETYYERIQAGGIASAERDFKQEYALIEGREVSGADGP